MKSKYYVFVMLILTTIFLTSCSISQHPENNLSENEINVSSVEGDSEKLVVYFFWGDGCPHCATQKPYLTEWQEKYSNEIEIKMFETWKNSYNVPIFQEIASAHGTTARGVPATFIGEKNWVGFNSGMAVEMEDYIKNCIKNTCETPLD